MFSVLGIPAAFAAGAIFVDTGMHDTNVSTIAASHDLIATGGLDGSVRVWSQTTGATVSVASVDGPRGGVITSLAFNPEGDRLLVGGQDLGLVDVRTGELVAWRQDAAVSALSWVGGRLYAGGPRGRVDELDPLTLHPVAQLLGCESWIVQIAVAPDGRVGIPCSAPASVRVTEPGLQRPEAMVTTVTKPQWAAWSPDGRGLAVVGVDARIVEILSAPTSRRLVLGWRVARVAWSGANVVIGGKPEGRREGRLHLVEPTGREGWSRPVAEESVVVVDSLPGGALAWGSAIAAWGITEADGSPRFRFTSPAFEMSGASVGYSPGGRVVEVDTAERHLVFDLASGSLREVASGRVGQAVLTRETLARLAKPGGPTLWTTEPNTRDIVVLADGVEVRRIRPRSSPLGSDVTQDGRVAVTNLLDGTLRWHSVVTGEELASASIGADGQSWAAWTPAGAYATSPGFRYPLRRWDGERGHTARLVDVGGGQDLNAVWGAVAGASAR